MQVKNLENNSIGPNYDLSPSPSPRETNYPHANKKYDNNRLKRNNMTFSCASNNYYNYNNANNTAIQLKPSPAVFSGEFDTNYYQQPRGSTATGISQATSSATGVILMNPAAIFQKKQHQLQQQQQQQQQLLTNNTFKQVKRKYAQDSLNNKNNITSSPMTSLRSPAFLNSLSPPA